MKIGDTVYWNIGKGKHKKTFEGKVFDLNPIKAPNSIGVNVGGEKFFPIGKLHKRR